MDGQTGGQSAAADDLLDYDLDFEDIIRDKNGQDNAAAAGQQPSGPTQQNVDDANLGLDEEIKVTKKRRPVPKLDEEKLLSQKGIPRLRKKARKLDLHGKGHEYADVTKLLSLYQLWLDDLHPKVKFADGLAIIEKLGHSKRMTTMRKEWLNEAMRQRQGYHDMPMESSLTATRDEPILTSTADNHEHGMGISTATDQDNGLFVNEGGDGYMPSTALLPANDMDDDLDALLAEPSIQALSLNSLRAARSRDEDTDMPLTEQANKTVPQPQQLLSKAVEPSEDDLDAMLAEEDEVISAHKDQGKQKQTIPDGFDDDWEAMQELGM
ncbi:Nuclear control of ATPase protein 2 [Ascosphaera pollenicola]|nr:Nuclear control of ATPase protein 2 [Ascosphaera pollenicola]